MFEHLIIYLFIIDIDFAEIESWLNSDFGSTDPTPFPKFANRNTAYIEIIESIYHTFYQQIFSLV